MLNQPVSSHAEILSDDAHVRTIPDRDTA